MFFDLLFFNIKISKNNKKELIFNKIYGIVVKSEKGCGQIMNQRLILFSVYACNIRGFRGIWNSDHKTASKDDDDSDTGILFCL